MNGAVPVARGCGTRVAGGIYAECGTSENGLPVEAYLMDPPEAIPEHLHLAPQGVAWVERRGVWHLVDWVGSEHYPNVADFIEECRRYGLSRRVPRTAPFERLTPASRILLVHARAIITNGAAYRPKDGAPYSCPMAATARWEEARGGLSRRPVGLVDSLKMELHKQGECSCAGLFWEDVEEGEAEMPENPRLVRRRMPALRYSALRRPEGIEPEYQPGFFASFPLHRLVVVKDPAGIGEQKDAAARSSLPVEVVDK